MSIIHRSKQEPIRSGLSWEEMWQASDRGLVISWERGRMKSLENPELAKRCLNGELPVLPWKGGVDKSIKGKKYGSLLYLAMWQGLRNEDLNVDMSNEVTLICTKSNVQVTYSPNLIALEANQQAE